MRKEYDRRKREKAKKKANETKHLSLAEFNALARERGLTYGQLELELWKERERKNVI